MSALSFKQALLLLGISPEANAGEVRRAYLRLLKKFKPEKDAEGFMRLRQAYELVIEQIQWGAVSDQGSDGPYEETDVDESGDNTEEVSDERMGVVYETNAHGIPDSQWETLTCYPTKLTDEEIDELKNSRKPRILLALAFAFLERRQLEEAIETGEKALERANEIVDFSPYYYIELVDLILCLFQYEKIESVLPLFSQLEETWAVSGCEAHYVSDEDGAKWLLLQEFVRVIWDMPTPVRELLSKAIRQMNFEDSDAALELSSYLSKNKRKIKWVRKQTQVYAPNIDAILANMTGQWIIETEDSLYWHKLKLFIAAVVLVTMTRIACRPWCDSVGSKDNSAIKSEVVEDKDKTSGLGQSYFDYQDTGSSLEPP